LRRNVVIVIAYILLTVLCGTITIPPSRAYAQPIIEWSKTIGGWDWDVAYSVQQTDDGGYILVGYTWSSGAGVDDVYLVKTDNNGREQWSKTFGGPYNDTGFDVQQTMDGGYVIVGGTTSFDTGDYDVYLIKTSSNGNEVWTKTFGDPDDDNYGYSVQQTTDGGYIIAGEAWLSDTDEYDVYIIKTDSEGEKEWGFLGGGSGDDGGYSVQQTTDGGYIIAGYTDSFGVGFYDVYLVKTDSNGEREWQKTFGGPEDDGCMFVQQTSDGGYIIVGYSCSFSEGDYDVYLVKTDSNGNEEWSKTFGDTGDDFGHSVQETYDGGFVIVGDSNSFNGGDYYYDVYLIKTDSIGEEEWSETFGYSDDDTGWSVKQTTDGGYIIAAETWDPNVDDVDVYLIKVKMEKPEAEPEADGNGGFVIPGFPQNTITIGLLVIAFALWFMKRKP